MCKDRTLAGNRLQLEADTPPTLSELVCDEAGDGDPARTQQVGQPRDDGRLAGARPTFEENLHETLRGSKDTRGLAQSPQSRDEDELRS